MGETITHLYIHAVADPRMDELLLLVRQIARGLHTMSDTLQTELDALTATVARTSGVDDSILVFVQGVPALIQAAADKATAAGAQPAQLAAFAALNAQLTAKTDEIAAAITSTGTGTGAAVAAQPAAGTQGATPGATGTATT
jgi:hypothetical protein